MLRDADEMRDRIGEAIKRAGWSHVSRKTKIDRVSLHRMFGPTGRPKLTYIMRVLPHVGLKLIIAPK